jgi:catechol 2,3-dioxygenase-like lactoylglutathione lyase family enzyme
MIGGVQVRAIDHVQLAMPAGGEDDARAFYAGLLGIPEVPKPPHLAVRGGCWFESPTVKVHLGVDGDFRPARKAHPALLVTDLPALTRRLVEAGVEVVDDEPLDGYDRVYASDPFGNRIELLEPLLRSAQKPSHERQREATAGDSARRGTPSR